jgi:hypothetical protein
MTIRLLRTERIAVDGLSVRFYRAGDILNVPAPLAAALIRDGIATSDLQPPQKPEPKYELPLAHTPKQQFKPNKKREYRS